MPWTNQLPTYVALIYGLMKEKFLPGDAFRDLFPEFEPLNHDRLYSVAQVMDDNNECDYTENIGDYKISAIFEKPKYENIRDVIYVIESSEEKYCLKLCYSSNVPLNTRMLYYNYRIPINTKVEDRRVYFKDTISLETAEDDKGISLSWLNQGMITIITQLLEIYFCKILYKIYLKRGAGNDDREILPHGPAFF